MPTVHRGGASPSISGGGTGNITQKRRSIKITTANLISYPGNFDIKDFSVTFAASTGNFTDIVKTLWAKE